MSARTLSEVNRDADSDDAIRAIHNLAAIEAGYVMALNMGRGMKQHTKNMERQRVYVYQLIMGRPPTADELQRLVWGDG